MPRPLALFALGIILCARPNCALAAEPLYFGVSEPLTGPDSQYGAQWKRGFDLALAEINAKGGTHGRPLQYIFEDSQSDPRQSIAVAQKFVNDPRGFSSNLETFPAPLPWPRLPSTL